MEVSSLTRSTMLALLLAGVACARNNSSDAEVGAARDTTTAGISDSVYNPSAGISDSTNHNQAAGMGDSAMSDSAQNQTQSGATDSSGQSTLGPGAEKTRPDQGQPVTSKGDTVNPGVDSSTKGR
jgi:hypothetical protein